VIWNYLAEKFHMHRRPRLFFLAALTVGLMGGMARGQIAKTASNTAAAKEPTPIPLAEVVPQSSSVSENLRQIEENLSAHRLSATVDQKVTALTNDIDAGLSENYRILTDNPLLYELGRLEAGWQQFGERLSFWSRLLTGKANELDGEVARLDQLGKTWEQTFKLARSSGAPPAVLQRTQELIAAINQTHEKAGSQLAEVLTLQSRVAEQFRRVSAARDSAETTRKEIVDHLLVQDGPPIWSAAMSSTERKNLVWASYRSFRRQLTAIRDYAWRNRGAFLAHAVALGLLLGILYWERPKVQRWIKEEPSFDRLAPIFNVPIATAVAFLFPFSRLIYPLAPQLLLSALGGVSLLATAIVLRRLIDRRLFPVLNVLLVLYVLEQLRAVTASVPLLSRPLFLAEMLAGILFLLWLIRSARLSSLPQVQKDRSSRAIQAYARFAVVIFSAALMANALGYVGLANVLGLAVLGGAYVAFVLYAALRIAGGLFFGLMKVRPFAMLGVVRRHGPLLQERGQLVLRYLALLLWLGYTLELLALREPFLEKLGEALSAPLKFGSLQFSLGHILTFCVTVWAAFLVSRFVRFVLEEDVYQRLQLARGLPYAISTVLHYAILLAGFFFGAAALGVDMTKFTILAGAFTVGVGFGLQNIINNFVSGLILLFERPVKVGDVIQVGDAAGVVQRIGIRAIVLRAGDGSELIVPNGNLISNRVTNWTFSDSQRLIEVPVAVAQAADPDHVIELLKSVAAANPLVTPNPPPQALVVNLGPGALSFELRAWTDRAENWMQIRSELAVAIKSVLAQENISIP
jgi:potassium-dependent mechanosensitive channel